MHQTEALNTVNEIANHLLRPRVILGRQWVRAVTALTEDEVEFTRQSLCSIYYVMQIAFLDELI